MPESTPRGPTIVNKKSETLDYPDDYKAKMRQWREAAKAEAIETLRQHPEYSEIRKYISYLEGKYWDPNRPRYRSPFFDNRLMEARIQALSMLTDIRPMISVSTKVKEYEDQAHIADRVIRAEWYRNDLDLKLVDVVDHALLGIGYWKIGAGSPGYTVVLPCGADNVLPIQPGSTLQESTAVLYRAHKTMNYFLERWPQFKDEIQKQAKSASVIPTGEGDIIRPDTIAEYTWSALSPSMRKRLALRKGNPARHTGESPFPVIELEEYWIEDMSVNETPETVIMKDPYLSLDAHNWHYSVRPGERLYPRKRLVIFAGNELLYDGPSIFWHGMYPFVELALNPAVWAPYGLSKYRDLYTFTQAINEVVAGILDLVKKAVNPQVIAKENAVRESVWRKFFPDMPGGKLRIAPIADPLRDIRYMEPPPIPAYVLQMLLNYLIPSMDRHSGAVDVVSLGRKRQVPGGETIEQMRDTMQSRFRLESRRVEAFLRKAGLQAVSNIFQFYTRRQRMRMLGADGLTWQDFDYDPDTMVPYSMPKEDHWRMFAVDIAQGSSHGASKERAKQVAIVLYRIGAISRKKLLRELEMTDQEISEIEDELMKERSAGLGLIAAGRTPRLTRSEKARSQNVP